MTPTAGRKISLGMSSSDPENKHLSLKPHFNLSKDCCKKISHDTRLSFASISFALLLVIQLDSNVDQLPAAVK